MIMNMIVSVHVQNINNQFYNWVSSFRWKEITTTWLFKCYQKYFFQILFNTLYLCFHTSGIFNYHISCFHTFYLAHFWTALFHVFTLLDVSTSLFHVFTLLALFDYLFHILALWSTIKSGLHFKQVVVVYWLCVVVEWFVKTISSLYV